MEWRILEVIFIYYFPANTKPKSHSRKTVTEWCCMSLRKGKKWSSYGYAGKTMVNRILEEVKIVVNARVELPPD